MVLIQLSGRVLRVLFFFFQAEDGIRDLTVTGVQTCALPISAAASPRPSAKCPIGGTGNRGGTVDSLASAQQQLNNAQLALRQAQQRLAGKIGRAAWRGRGEISVGAGSFKKKKK